MVSAEVGVARMAEAVMGRFPYGCTRGKQRRQGVQAATLQQQHRCVADGGRGPEASGTISDALQPGLDELQQRPDPRSHRMTVTVGAKQLQRRRA